MIPPLASVYRIAGNIGGHYLAKSLHKLVSCSRSSLTHTALSLAVYVPLSDKALCVRKGLATRDYAQTILVDLIMEVHEYILKF